MLINAVAGGGSGAEILLAVSVASGAVVTAEKGSLKVTGVAVNGLCTLSIPEAGEWTVSAALEDMTSDTQTVTVVGNYSSALTFGDSIGQKAVGSSVYLNVNGVRTEFLVVQQGKPNSTYDDSCDGTWLLMNSAYDTRSWGNVSSGWYEDSGIYTFLNGDFLDLLDSAIRGQVKQVKVPYKGKDYAVHSGANGLAVKAFLLSSVEVGFPTSGGYGAANEGARLSYFPSGTSADAKRVLQPEVSWWTRSLFGSESSRVTYVNSSGAGGYTFNTQETTTHSLRPAIIVPSNLLVTNDGTLRV